MQNSKIGSVSWVVAIIAFMAAAKWSAVLPGFVTTLIVVVGVMVLAAGYKG